MLEDIVNQLPSEEVRRQPYVLFVEGGRESSLRRTQKRGKKSFIHFIRDVNYGVYISSHVLMLDPLSYNNIGGF
jgi:hypothetical protein